MSALTNTRHDRRFGAIMREASKPHICTLCGGSIAKGEFHYVRPERAGRRLHSRREHYLCPIPEPVAVAPEPIRIRRKRKAPDWTVPALLMLLGLIVLALIVAQGWGAS